MVVLGGIGRGRLMYEEKRSLKKKKQKEKFIRIFWWTLLIHAIIFLGILDIAFKGTPKIFLPKKPPPNLAQIPESELPASLKPRKSVFGGTVLFDDKAGFKPTQSKLLALKEQPGENDIQGPSQKSIPQKKSPELISEKKESTATPTKTQVNKPLEKKESADAEAMANRLHKKTPDIARKPVLVSQIQQFQDSPNSKNSLQPKITKIKTPGTAEKNKSPIKLPRKSIISMTKGFLNNLKDEGEDWLKRKGDDNKRPSFEELKYISYEESINWNLQNSFENNPVDYQYEQISKAEDPIIWFKIKENGDVCDIELIEGSGVAKIDNSIIRNIKEASPYPPIPKHFGETIYQVRRIFNLHLKPRRF